MTSVRALRLLPLGVLAVATGCGLVVGITDLEGRDGAPVIDGRGGDAPQIIDGGIDGPVFDARPVIDAPDAPPGTPDARPTADAPRADAAIFPDAGPLDASPVDAPACGTICPVGDGCGPTEVCGVDGSGNGLDDNCDGAVDETCACMNPGEVRPCFRGPPGRQGEGTCSDGVMHCVSDGPPGTWSACTNGLFPLNEACDGLDNDCDGCTDECCTATGLTCPTSLPDIAPFATATLNAGAWYGGTDVSSWRWTVEGTPCDGFVQGSGAGRPSYLLGGSTTASATFKPSLSGAYVMRVEITRTDGSTLECRAIQHVRGPGLRVELCFDRLLVAGGPDADLDIHLHKPDDTTAWFYTGPITLMNPNPSDCHFTNCKAMIGTSTRANWGYASSPLSSCAAGPGMWNFFGSCPNPRLEMDSYDIMLPMESTAIDAPPDAKTYRVLVHDYDSMMRTTLAVHPILNIWCGGEQEAIYGADLPRITLTRGGNYGLGQMWHAVDVTTAGTGCSSTLLHASGMSSGYKITTDNVTF